MTEQDLHNNWPIRPEQDNQQLHSSEVKLNRTFRDVRKILTKPYDPKYQYPLEMRFRTSIGRIVAIGLIEDRSGKPDRPKFIRFYDEWHGKRDEAVSLGYALRTFEEYSEKKSAIS